MKTFFNNKISAWLVTGLLIININACGGAAGTTSDSSGTEDTGSGGSGGSGDVTTITGNASSLVENPTLMRALRMSSNETGDEVPAEESADDSGSDDVGLSDITVYAMDTEGNETSTQLDADGGFSLSLNIGLSYMIGFTNGETFLGVLTFDLGEDGSFSSIYINLTGEVSIIELGDISFEGGIAIPEFNPLNYVDEDGDGTCDHDDEDYVPADFEDYESDDSEDSEEESDPCSIEESEESDDSEDSDGSSEDEALAHEGEEDPAFEDEGCDPEEDPTEDIDYLEVRRTNPRDGEVGFPVDERIRINFDRAVDMDTINSDTVALSDGENDISGSFDVTDGGRTVVFTPDYLDTDTTYYLWLSSEVTDEEGVPMSEDFELLFSTEYGDDWELNEEGECPWEEDDSDNDGELDISIEIWIEIHINYYNALMAR